MAFKATQGDSASGMDLHATFESIATDNDGGVLLGGAENNVGGTEFKYKSAGNVPEGDAFVWGIPLDKLDKEAGPDTSDCSFKWRDAEWTSVKAVRVGDRDGNAIALVHREKNSKMEAGLVLLDKKGKAKWGPNFYKSQTEGTDLAVAPDFSGFVITGHGSTAPLDKAAEYKSRLTRVDPLGHKLWTINNNHI